jgi:PAS domain S-box-containing protein
VVADVSDDRQIFPSRLAARPSDRRWALAIVLVSSAFFLMAVPFARTPLTPVWGFIPFYQSALVVNDLITAVLLLGQFTFLQSPALLVLATGYLFTAFIAIAHALTFPGLFAPTGLLGAGPQSTAWLFMFWHGGFPLFVIAYARLKSVRRRTPPAAAIPGCVAGAALVASGFTLLATRGHDALPVIMRGNHYAPAMSLIVTSTWVLSLLALGVLWWRRPRTVLDLWLMVVMSAWVFDIALAAVLNAGRFDLGFYAGRIYGLLAASLVLIVLLVENGKLYARLIAAHERRSLLERRESREALRQSEATALAFIESAAEGILIVDERGRIVVANGQIEAMFGYAQRELIGQPMELLLPEKLRDRHVGHRADYTAAPRVRRMGIGLDLAGRRRDGTEFPVEISLSYVRTPSGVRVMAFITDITERLLLERTARQAEKLAALGTLSAGIAHELNNPLGIIGTRIELMLLESEEAPLSPPVREDLGVIQRQVQRVSRLVEGLLAYARPSDSERRAVDLNDVVDEVLLLAQKQLSKDGVRVSAALDRSLPPILGDHGALEQVVLNLVTNAQQAMDGPGDVVITTRSAGEKPGWVELVVTDTGRGISAEHLSRIFDPYFTTKAMGTGLGLSITHRIVEEHGGTIQVRSTVGKGTEFILSFPTTNPG